jgi:hypothetical protein
MDGITGLDPAKVTTNYVVFELRPTARRDPLELRAAFLAEARARGVAFIAYGSGTRVRALTHYGVERADIARALEATQASLAATGIAPSTVHAGRATP